MLCVEAASHFIGYTVHCLFLLRTKTYNKELISNTYVESLI